MDEPEWVDAFADALTSVGIDVCAPDRYERTKDSRDVLINVRGRSLPVTLKHVRAATPLDLSRRFSGWQSEIESTNSIPVLVGDRITASAREILHSHGWGWLDLRGHLHIVGPGLLVDTPVDPFRRRAKRSDALAGSAGVEVASFLLIHANRKPIVREIAREVGRSPSTVSEILQAFRDEGIITEDGSVAERELFWRLSEAWKRQSAWLASAPDPGNSAVNMALLLGLESVESSTGWALTDTRAAALYGAPIGIRSDYPPDFYVPTQRSLNRAVKVLGEVRNFADRKATATIAPAPIVCKQRIDATRNRLGREKWPLAHPVFVALNLASDPGRGMEILEGWNPPEPWHRVW